MVWRGKRWDTMREMEGKKHVKNLGSNCFFSYLRSVFLIKRKGNDMQINIEEFNALSDKMQFTCVAHGPPKIKAGKICRNCNDSALHCVRFLYFCPLILWIHTCLEIPPSSFRKFHWIQFKNNDIISVPSTIKGVFGKCHIQNQLILL